MERDKTLSMVIYGGSAISALIVIISMFFRYTVAKTGIFVRSGFQIFNSSNTLNIVLMVLCLILAIIVIVLAIMRLMGMLEDKMYTYIFVSLAIALAIVSIIMFFTITKIEWAGFTSQYKKGAGLVLNLIFSIISALFALCALLFDPKRV